MFLQNERTVNSNVSFWLVVSSTVSAAAAAVVVAASAYSCDGVLLPNNALGGYRCGCCCCVMILALGVGFIIHADRTEGNVVPIRTHNSNDFVIICAKWMDRMRWCMFICIQQ
jgi:hypothetical protein